MIVFQSRGIATILTLVGLGPMVQVAGKKSGGGAVWFSGGGGDEEDGFPGWAIFLIISLGLSFFCCCCKAILKTFDEDAARVAAAVDRHEAACNRYNARTKTPARRTHPTNRSPDTFVIRTTFHKPTQDSKTGIGFGRAASTGHPVITSVKGIAAKTTLKKGMRLLTINGHACPLMETALELLVSAPAGALTITAGSPNTRVATLHNDMGFSIVQYQGGGLELRAGSGATKYGLQEGYKIVQVNGVFVKDMNGQADMVASMTDKTPNGITIVAVEGYPGQQVELSVEEFPPEQVPAPTAAAAAAKDHSEASATQNGSPEMDFDV